MSQNYYIAQRGKLMKQFGRASRWIMPTLANQYGQEYSDVVLQDARTEFESLIPLIPYIGGSKNRWTSDLVESAQMLAFFRAMKIHGKTAKETGEIVLQGLKTRLARYPRFLLRLLGMLQFTKPFLKRLERQALESQKRRFPENFVAYMVSPNGENFDWGIDFTECAIANFFKAQDAWEFLPYLCRLDYVTSEAFGLGMVRTKTLAEGEDRCNPRLKRSLMT